MNPVEALREIGFLLERSRADTFRVKAYRGAATLVAQMSEDDTTAAIETIKTELGASGMKDMGRVMAELKARHASELDMSKASGLVKAALS